MASSVAQSSRPDGAAVTIVMRTKDRPLLLRRALHDVLAQDYTGWRLHLVNDGGEAGAVERLVGELAHDLAGRMRVWHNPRSLGMETASGQALAGVQTAFFAIHDDDDTWEAQFLSRTVAFLEAEEHAEDVGVVTAHTLIRERIAGESVLQEEARPGADIAGFADLASLMAGNRTPPISLLFRTSLLAQIDGFDPRLPVLGDWEFALRALSLGDIGEIDEPLARYHERRKPEDPAYGNTVTEGRKLHLQTGRRLRNAALRTLLGAQPDLFGGIQAILHAQDAAHEETRSSLQRLLQFSLGQQNIAATQILRTLAQLAQDQAELPAMRAELAALRSEIAALRTGLACPVAS